MAEYQNKTSRQRYMTDKRYTEYREIVFVSRARSSSLAAAADAHVDSQENLYDGKAVPNIKKLIPIGARPLLVRSLVHR